ncbi:hypothetical protein GmHk_U059989 [Glycine max]|nr:hypothetical protein GmHk_U059989 [Glycine max]
MDEGVEIMPRINAAEITERVEGTPQQRGSRGKESCFVLNEYDSELSCLSKFKHVCYASSSIVNVKTLSSARYERK